MACPGETCASVIRRAITVARDLVTTPSSLLLACSWLPARPAPNTRHYDTHTQSTPDPSRKYLHLVSRALAACQQSRPSSAIDSPAARHTTAPPPRPAIQAPYRPHTTRPAHKHRENKLLYTRVTMSSPKRRIETDVCGT
jgi:hypothetical protein